MKLYDNKYAPNTRRVRLFLAEKGLLEKVTLVDVDLLKGEQLSDEFKAMNPYRRIPVLKLHNGKYIAESQAICRYFEELYPPTPLFGTTPEQKAEVEMWTRRVELGLMNAIAAEFRHGPKFYHPSEQKVPEWGEVNATMVDKHLHMLNKHLADNQYLCGSYFSVADIALFASIQFAAGMVKHAVPDSNEHLLAYYQTLKQRPAVGLI